MAQIELNEKIIRAIAFDNGELMRKTLGLRAWNEKCFNAAADMYQELISLTQIEGR